MEGNLAKTEANYRKDKLVATGYGLGETRALIERACSLYSVHLKDYLAGNDRKLNHLRRLGNCLEKYSARLRDTGLMGPRMYNHEILNSLNVLKVIPENILYNGLDDLKEDFKENATNSLESLVVLSPLIEMKMVNPIDLSRVSQNLSGKNLLDSTVLQFSKNLKDSYMNVSIETKPAEVHLYAPVALARSIFGTLLGDAIKYSPKGTPEKMTEIVLKLKQTKKTTSFEVINPYDPNAPVNYPNQIGTGSGTGGRFLDDIKCALRGASNDRYYIGEGKNQKHIAQVSIPTKYLDEKTVMRALGRR